MDRVRGLQTNKTNVLLTRLVYRGVLMNLKNSYKKWNKNKKLLEKELWRKDKPLDLKKVCLLANLKLKWKKSSKNTTKK